MKQQVMIAHVAMIILVSACFVESQRNFDGFAKHSEKRIDETTKLVPKDPFAAPVLSPFSGPKTEELENGVNVLVVVAVVTAAVVVLTVISFCVYILCRYYREPPKTAECNGTDVYVSVEPLCACSDKRLVRAHMNDDQTELFGEVFWCAFQKVGTSARGGQQFLDGSGKPVKIFNERNEELTPLYQQPEHIYYHF